MFIVKKKAEVVRLGLFLALMGAMAYFIATHADVWRTSEQPAQSAKAAGAPIVTGLQEANLLDVVQAKALNEDFFADYRLKRDQDRDSLREVLREVLNSQNLDSDAKRQAGAQLLEVGRLANLENQAESLVRAKGFEDVLVHIGSDSAQVVVRSKPLTDQQAMTVMDMVSKIGGIKVPGIVVMARER
jgi:stage III sporulation protein AH